MCSPTLLAGRSKLRAADLLQYPLIHFDWFSPGAGAPTWRQWWATARSVDPALPDLTEDWALRFREELHALDAVIARAKAAVYVYAASFNIENSRILFRVVGPTRRDAAKRQQKQAYMGPLFG